MGELFLALMTREASDQCQYFFVTYFRGRVRHLFIKLTDIFYIIFLKIQEIFQKTFQSRDFLLFLDQKFYSYFEVKLETHPLDINLIYPIYLNNKSCLKNSSITSQSRANSKS